MATTRLFKVGADPEFGFLDDDGQVISAASVLHASNHFGLDGCNAIAEMRPSPSINPSQVVQNLYDDFVKGYMRSEKIRDLTWKAGSSVGDGDNFAIGGHIHLGIHSVVSHKLFGDRHQYYNKLVRYLDCYLAQPVRLLENPRETKLRLDGEYGYLGDHRSNSHGLEYRTLGSWLTSPRVAEGVLCLAQTIAYEHMNNTVHKVRMDLGSLMPTPESDDDYDEQGDLIAGQESPDLRKELKSYRKKLPTLQQHIRTMKLYKRHELPIEFLFKLIENKKSWFPGANGEQIDMKVAWGLTPAALPKIHIVAEKELPKVKFDDIWKRARK